MDADEIDAERCVGEQARTKAIEAFRDAHWNRGAPATHTARASGWVVTVMVKREVTG
jgi:hypothetical protein